MTMIMLVSAAMQGMAKKYEVKEDKGGYRIYDIEGSDGLKWSIGMEPTPDNTLIDGPTPHPWFNISDAKNDIPTLCSKLDNLKKEQGAFFEVINRC